MTNIDIEQHVYHHGLDLHGNAMTAGQYLMTRVGHDPLIVDIVEDEVTGDLAFPITIDGVEIRQRVEECAADVTFLRC